RGGGGGEGGCEGGGGGGGGGGGALPREPADGLQAPLGELAEVALDGRARHAGEARDGAVRQALGFEPEDFHLALHERLRVVVPVEREGRQVVGGKGEARLCLIPAWQ